MTVKRNFRRTGVQGALLSAGSVVNGVINAGVLAASARQGQTDEIAAYTVVVGVLAFVSVITGGGSALLYISGSPAERLSVKSQRLFIVLPSLILGTVAAGIWYTSRGYTWTAIAFAGVVVVGNNLAELQFGDFARQARFRVNAAIPAISKIPALVMVLLDQPLTVALAISVVLQFVVNHALLRGTFPPGEVISLRHLRLSHALKPGRAARPLFSYSILELFNARAAAIALSMFVSPHTMGIFGTVLSTYQAVSAVFYTALQVPMAARSRKRLGLSGEEPNPDRSELFAIAGALLTALLLYASAPWVALEVLKLGNPISVTWLRIFAVALPLYLANRAAAMMLIGRGDYRRAMRVVTPVSASLALSMAVLMPPYEASGAASSMLLAESVAVIVLATRYVWSSRFRGRCPGSPAQRFGSRVGTTATDAVPPLSETAGNPASRGNGGNVGG